MKGLEDEDSDFAADGEPDKTPQGGADIAVFHIRLKRWLKSPEQTGVGSMWPWEAIRL